MKREDKIFTIGISSHFLTMILVLVEAGKIFDPEKFHWISGSVSRTIIFSAIFFLGISILMFIKFLKIPEQ